MKTVKLMADYECYPLWNMSPGEYGDVNPSDLPISKDLQLRLAKWAKMYDDTLDVDYPPNSGFKSKELEAEFSREGQILANMLRSELGAEFVVMAQM